MIDIVQEVKEEISLVEIWKDVIGYNGKYQISNTGKIRSTNYNNTGQIKELKLKLNKYGYYEVKLSKNNVTKDYMVGRLVAQHFIPNQNFKPKVIHKNDVRDNSIQNLKWVYESEAMHNQYNNKHRKGKSSNTIITYNNKKYKRYSDIAKDLGINKKTFSSGLYELNWSLYEALEIPIGRSRK